MFKSLKHGRNYIWIITILFRMNLVQMVGNSKDSQTLDYTFTLMEDDFKLLDPKFLSFALDSSLLTKSSIEQEILKSKIFRKLVRHLGPSYIRFGGTTSNLIYFENDQILNKKSNNAAQIDENNLIPTTFAESENFDRPNIVIKDLHGNDITKNSLNDIDNYLEGKDLAWDCGESDTVGTIKSRARRASPKFEKWQKHRTSGGQLKYVKMSPQFYDSLHDFTQSVGWDLIFSLGLLYGYHQSEDHVSNSENELNSWDPTNTEALLEYSRSKGYNVSVWQLGNEPNSFPHKFNLHNLTAKQLANDFALLKNRILPNNFPRYKGSLVAGPDVTKIVKTGDKKGKKGKNPYSLAAVYLQDFLREAQSIYESRGGNTVVDKITWHHYYIDGKTATPADFIDPKVLDSFKLEIEGLFSVLNAFPKTLYNAIWLSEGGSAFGGGADGLSNRFIAGFMFLDKLGLCARLGVELVIRQSLYQGRYALIDSELSPNPDYWTALLFKRLVGSIAFNIQLDGPSSGEQKLKSTIRLYGHCVNPDNPWYKGSGALVFYASNLNNRTAQIKMADLGPNRVELGKVLHTYLLTTPTISTSMYEWDDPLLDPLKSKKIALNGKTLRLRNNGNLPPLKPIINGENGADLSTDMVLPPFSYGFFVYPKANFKLCLTKFK